MGWFTRPTTQNPIVTMQERAYPSHYERPFLPVVNMNGNTAIPQGIAQIVASLGPNESFYGSIEPTPNGGVAFAFHRRSTKGDVEAFASMVADELMKRNSR